MDTSLARVRASAMLRAASQELDLIAEGLSEAGLHNLAAESFDLQVQLLRLLKQVAEPLSGPLRPPGREQTPSTGQDRIFHDDVPF